MRVNHLIIGTGDVSASRDFYVSVLGFREVDRFVDTGTGAEGRVLVHYDAAGRECLELLLVPFRAERLPSPQHLALEVDTETFDGILGLAMARKLPVRAEPPLGSPVTGAPGKLDCRGVRYERFYLLDPSRVNIEILRRL